MKRFLLPILVILLALASCSRPVTEEPPVSPPSSTPKPTLAPTPSPTPSPTLAYPPVVGEDPSPRVAAFYYPWYRNLTHDGQWIHWDQGNLSPALEIPSNFYPVLGTYSSLDPEVVAQHFAWLRQAGVGVIITSWWGQGSREEAPVPLLLEMGERYGIKVAFLIECYGWRSAEQLVKDVKYLYSTYGDHPAFFRTSTGSLWSQGEKQQGLFLMWGVVQETDVSTEFVAPSYWAAAMDEIHALPDGGLMISDMNEAEWVTQGHFDGSYKYGALDVDMEEPYTFAESLPRGAWYIPGINPGFDRSHIIGSEDFTYSPRRDGAAYAERWQAMFDLGIEPQMVAITTFNEWHEGTQIEPAAAGVVGKGGYVYRDYGTLPPTGYLELTRQWVETFRAYEWPVSSQVTIRMTTTSDWTYFKLESGGRWMQPEVLSASPEATFAGAEGGRLSLNQPLQRAELGKKVVMEARVLISPEGDTPLVFDIGRGGLGYTQVELLVDTASGPKVVATLWWNGFANNADNTRQFLVPVESLLPPGN